MLVEIKTKSYVFYKIMSESISHIQTKPLNYKRNKIKIFSCVKYIYIYMGKQSLNNIIPII